MRSQKFPFRILKLKVRTISTASTLLLLTSQTFPDPPFTELGCFDERDVDDFKLEWDGVNQDRTPETCIYYCYNAGMRYAGTVIIM